MLHIADICTSIINFFNDKQNIIRLELLSKFHKKTIRESNLYVYIIVKNDSVLEHIINNYNLKKIDLNKIININNYVYKLKKCHTLNLSKTNITDESVKELKNRHKLILYGTNITKLCVRELRNNGCIVNK